MRKECGRFSDWSALGWVMHVICIRVVALELMGRRAWRSLAYFLIGVCPPMYFFFLIDWIGLGPA